MTKELLQMERQTINGRRHVRGLWNQQGTFRKHWTWFSQFYWVLSNFLREGGREGMEFCESYEQPCSLTFSYHSKGCRLKKTFPPLPCVLTMTINCLDLGKIMPRSYSSFPLSCKNLPRSWKILVKSYQTPGSSYLKLPKILPRSCKIFAGSLHVLR